MAQDAAFASTPKCGAALLGNAETSLTVPTLASIVISAAAAGTKIESIMVEAVANSLAPTTVLGLVYLFLHDGSNYHLFDTVNVRAVAGSATATPYRANDYDFASGSHLYPALWVPTGWSLRASQSIAGNANILKVTAIGADL
jgi:hypothetical protein